MCPDNDIPYRCNHGSKKFDTMNAMQRDLSLEYNEVDYWKQMLERCIRP